MQPQMSFNYNGFYDTWCILDKKIDLMSVDIYTIPWIVNGSFACELGLKYILSINNVEFKREHRLHKLFELLPDNDKMAIFNDICEKLPNYSNEQLIREILLVSDAFCNFRYAHEHSLTSNLPFYKVWFEAIFKQVSLYPSYMLVERLGEPGITLDEIDAKILNTQNEMLSNLKKKENNKK